MKKHYVTPVFFFYLNFFRPHERLTTHSGGEGPLNDPSQRRHLKTLGTVSSPDFRNDIEWELHVLVSPKSLSSCVTYT